MNMKTINISNASIAEEVRKQMALATFNEKGLMGADGFLSGSSIINDANLIKRSGTYMTSPESINTNVKTWGTLIVFGSYYVIQMQITASIASPIFSMRTCIADSWSVWKSITLT